MFKFSQRGLTLYLIELKNIAGKGFFHLFTAQGLILAAGFISQFFVAGFLEPADIGRVKIMQTYIGLATLFCGLGFNSSLLKLASEKIEENEKKDLYRAAFLVTLISFMFIYFLFGFLTKIKLISTDPEILRLFPLYSVFILPLALQSIQLSFYQAQKQIHKLSKLQVLVKSLSVLAIVVVTYFYKIDGYIIIVVVTGLLGVIVFELGLKGSIVSLFKVQPPMALFKKMWSLASYALLANIVGFVVSTTDIFFINYLVGDKTEIGFYMFALTILSIYQIFPSTVQQIALPYFSEQSAAFLRWWASYRKYNRLNHIMSLLLVLAGCIFVPLLISLAFSGKYDRSIYYFLLLSGAWLLRSANIVKGTALMGYGRFDLNLRTSLIVLVVTTPILFILILHFGLNGAIIGMTLSALITYLTTAFIFNRFKQRAAHAL